MLARFRRLEFIPEDWRHWHVNATNAAALSRTLAQQHHRALLFRELATLRTDVPVFGSLEELRWAGPTERFVEMAARLDARVAGL